MIGSAQFRPGLAGNIAPGTDVQKPDTRAGSEISKRFEQMLWAEMLSHAGLEDALTKNGGQGVAEFSRFVVEAIAADIAEKHPLGIGTAGAEISEGDI